MKLPNRLPPSPSRSRRGYSDCAEWPDRERFIEMDCLLQHFAQERRYSDDHAYWRESDYVGQKLKGRTALSLVEIISGLEDMPALVLVGHAPVIKTRSQRWAAKIRRALVSALVAAAGIVVVVLLALWIGEVLS